MAKSSSLRRVVLISTLCLWAAESLAQSDLKIPGLTLDQVMAIVNSASGDSALHHISYLSLHHRWFVSDGYRLAAEYIKSQAIAAGLIHVEIESFLSDGKVHYATQRSLPKWTVKSASLELVSPHRKHLVSWDENPIILASNSRSADITTELVDVGEGVRPSDYQGKNVRGKLVLASSPQDGGRIELVHRLAVFERGAAGVVSYRGYALDDFPDLITWDHLWTLESEGKSSTFGFCIPKRMGWQLKRLLGRGESVLLHAKVDAAISEGQYEIVKCSIPGTDLADQEIWFIAHLDHARPSANDNASGSAAILETAKTLNMLFGSGLLPKPRRTLRFFWVPEIYGSLAYISKHLDEAKRAVAVFNMDMVGENQKLCGSTFRITRTPDSTSSYLNDILKVCLDFMLAQNIGMDNADEELTNPLAIVSPLGSRENWNAAMIPYSGGSDHAGFMGGGINIPATMFGCWPDYFYHSSGDTPDKCDPTQLKRAIVCGALAAASLAAMNSQAGTDVLNTMSALCLQRQDQAAGSALALLEKSTLSGEDLKEALNIVHQKALREMEALGSLRVLLPGDPYVHSQIEKIKKEIEGHRDLAIRQVREFYSDLCKIKKATPGSMALTDEERKADRWIPRRNAAFPGDFQYEYISMRVQEKKLPAIQSRLKSFQRYETAAFIDGRRSVLEIRNAVSAETGPVPLSDMISYLRLLESIELIFIK